MVFSFCSFRYQQISCHSSKQTCVELARCLRAKERCVWVRRMKKEQKPSNSLSPERRCSMIQVSYEDVRDPQAEINEGRSSGGHVPSLLRVVCHCVLQMEGVVCVPAGLKQLVDFSTLSREYTAQFLHHIHFIKV